LTKEEIRQLRTRLNAIEFNEDVFSKLPIELLLCLLEYLDFEDIIKTRALSTTWRSIWSSSDFAAGIVKIHFRAQWEQTDLGDETAKRDLVGWLSIAVKKRLRKQSGEYISTSVHAYNRDGALEHQYDSGRFAYRFGQSIKVQSLMDSLSQPKVYMEENRFPLLPGKWLLSNDLLVAHAKR